MSNIKAQRKDSIDVNSIFKMHLYLNDRISSFDPILKNDSLYLKYSSNTVILPNYLESQFFSDRYIFVHLDVEKDVQYIDYNIVSFSSTSPWRTKDLILAINTRNFRTYRLKGFDGNDFLDFMYDCIEDGQADSVKEFLKWNKVEGLDFKCLYKALRKKNRSRYKYYECLGRVNDPVTIS